MSPGGAFEWVLDDAQRNAALRAAKIRAAKLKYLEPPNICGVPFARRLDRSLQARLALLLWIHPWCRDTVMRGRRRHDDSIRVDAGVRRRPGAALSASYLSAHQGRHVSGGLRHPVPQDADPALFGGVRVCARAPKARRRLAEASAVSGPHLAPAQAVPLRQTPRRPRSICYFGASSRRSIEGGTRDVS